MEHLTPDQFKEKTDEAIEKLQVDKLGALVIFEEVGMSDLSQVFLSNRDTNDETDAK